MNKIHLPNCHYKTDEAFSDMSRLSCVQVLKKGLDEKAELIAWVKDIIENLK